MLRHAVFIAAVVIVALATAIPVSSQGMPSSRVGQFWGTFVHWVEFGPGLAFPAVVTLNIDGTFTVAGGTAAGIHGVWEITGPRTARFTGLLQNFDSAGNVIALERHRCAFEYSADFNSYKGTEFAETVACPTPLTCPNPLDPATKWTPAPWAPPAGISVHGARIQVVAPGALK